MGKMIRKILIANRGEIAARIIRTARKMGIRTVAVFSLEDKDSLHVRMADEAICIGNIDLSDTYLNIPHIISAALHSKADAIHPGYGFLSENPLFVKACDDAGIMFIGPRSDVMHTMGNKIAAREFAGKAGAPVVSGISGDQEKILASAGQLRFPVIVKAAAGGGGKGMQIVRKQEDLKDALESASRQAKAYFGDETVYLETYIEEPRHIEIQILGDQHGNVIHLYERECSIQRRYQKIIEESPSPTLNQEVREKMGAAAAGIGRAAGYTGAGTIEFLVDKELNFFFLEMNTRIQVEHPVTELVTGLDIVEEQIHIAEGKPLRYKQEDIRQCGHAIECRIYAEDPSNNFIPSPGTMTFYHEPSGPGIRVDSATEEATRISAAYDPMIAKLVTYGPDRTDGIGKMISALSEFIVHGIRTNISFLSVIMHDPAYLENRISTGYCDAHLPELIENSEERKKSIPEILPVSAFILHEINPEENATDVWKMTGFWRNMIQTGFSLEEKNILIPVRKKQHSAEINIENEIHEIKMLKNEDHHLEFLLDGNTHSAWVSEDQNGNVFLTTYSQLFQLKKELFLPADPQNFQNKSADNHSGEIFSPMPGKVIKINVSEGEKVEKGTLLMIVEAMKMENTIVAPVSGTVSKVLVALNDRVEAFARLIVVTGGEQN